MSMEERIRQFEQKRQVLNQDDEVLLRQTHSSSSAIKRSQKGTAITLSVLVEAESDEEHSEDVHDGPIVEGIKESDLEEEFMKIEMAQEALESVVKALYRKSQEARKSLDLKDTSAQTDLEQQTERPIDELVNEAIELASLSYDKQVRATIPKTLRQVQRQISQMPIDLTENSVSPNSVKSSPAPPPPPPPGPPPPPPPAAPPNSLKIKSKGSLASISSIQLKNDGTNNVANVELRIKTRKSDDLVNQLRNALQKRKKRSSLLNKYQDLK